MATKQDVTDAINEAWGTNHVKRLILQPFTPQGNSIDTARAMRNYLRQADLQLAAIHVTEADDKKNLLKLAGGKFIQDVDDTITDPAGRGDVYDKLVLKLKTHYRVNDLEIYSRFEILNITQKNGQSFQEYYTNVLVIANDCNYNANEKDKIIRDIVLKGVYSDKVRRTALEKSQNLEDLVKSANAIEHGNAQNQLMTHKAAVHRIDYQRNFQGQRHPSQGQQQRHKVNDKCYFCGGPANHSKDQCRAKNAECRQCGKIGHYAQVCKSKPKQNTHSQKKKFHKKRYNKKITEEEEDDNGNGAIDASYHINHVSL